MSSSGGFYMSVVSSSKRTQGQRSHTTSRSQEMPTSSRTAEVQRCGSSRNRAVTWAKYSSSDSGLLGQRTPLSREVGTDRLAVTAEMAGNGRDCQLLDRLSLR